MIYIMFSNWHDIYTSAMIKNAMMLSLILCSAMTSLAAEPSFFPACNECHSKNPKMVRMHSALGFKNCFSCHGYVKELPVKERIGDRASDERCLPCHK